MAEALKRRTAVSVSDEAFEYLVIQRGKISEHCSDRRAWLAAYHDSLEADYDSMRPYLPAVAERVMDVGSGLGGINVLLARYFWRAGMGFPDICLLDGDDDSPVMVKHAQTFNCMHTARRFLAANGLDKIVTASPGMEVQAAPCQLIISLQSWCFHYSPTTYLEYVKACAAPGCIIILDVRKRYIWWRKELAAAFKEIGVAQSAEKFDRVVYQA